MKEKFDKLIQEIEDCKHSIIDLNSLSDFRVKYLGKKGVLKLMMKEMGKLNPDERREFGQRINEIRDSLEELIASKKLEIEKLELDAKLKAEDIDVTLDIDEKYIGTRHPISHAIKELVDIFTSLGYALKEGPEIETVFNNFDALNSPIDHPSRSENDTFYFSDGLLLRTHTSGVQIRTMQSEDLPIRMISPGRCFRKDELDATHSPMFHQFEGLVVGKNITMADLKGTLTMFAKKMFGEDTKTIFRPHDFPFTEPSAEMDVSCFKCGGEGCKFCSGNGSIEILGCGMVHPKVLQSCGIDPDEYSGFAFGMGIDRIAMLKYEIDDIRLLYQNDIRFLKQF